MKNLPKKRRKGSEKMTNCGNVSSNIQTARQEWKRIKSWCINSTKLTVKFHLLHHIFQQNEHSSIYIIDKGWEELKRAPFKYFSMSLPTSLSEKSQFTAQVLGWHRENVIQSKWNYCHGKHSNDNSGRERWLWK